jgi:hypothetical protein
MKDLHLLMTLTARVARKLKTVASKPSKKAASTPKGKVSKPNVVSNSEAQQLPPLSSTIDFTKPISMILPDPPCNAPTFRIFNNLEFCEFLIYFTRNLFVLMCLRDYLIII